MRSLLLIVGLSVVAAGGCGAPASPPLAPEHPALPLSLRLGTVAEAALAGGASQAYRLDVPAGWFVELVVEQQGIDVLVRLEDLTGRLLTTVDSPNGPTGPETLLLLDEEGQPLRLIVAAPDPRVASGRYAIRVTALRPARARDRERVAAERTFSRAEALRSKREGAAFRQAVTEHRKALAAFRALGDRRREADVLDRLGRIHLQLGNLAAARTAYLQAVPLFRELGAQQAQVDALNGLGTADRSRGRPAEALACYREAQEILHSLGDRPSEANTWGNIGAAFMEQGDSEEAFRAYEQALAIWRQLGERGKEAITLGNMGRLYAVLGEAERARDTLERAAARLEDAGLLGEAGSVLTDLGMARARAGQPRDGLDAAQRALRLQRRAGDRRGEATALNALGWLHSQAGDLAAAHSCLQQALALYERLGQNADAAVVLTHLGQLAMRQGHLAEAVALFERALPPLAASGDRRREASVLYSRALAWRQEGDLAAALRSTEEALARIESLRAEPLSGDLKATFLASRQDIYELSIDLLFDLHRRQPAAGYAARALTAAERARTRTLLDRVGREGADPHLAAREGDVVRRLATAERRLRRLTADGAAAAADARADVDALVRERERLDAEMDTAPAPELQPLDAGEIQRRVAAPDRLLLEYSLGRTRSILWAVEPHRLEVFPLPARDRIEEVARRAHALLSSTDRTAAGTRIEETLAELSAMLLAPVADRLAGKRLLVVPDGALAYVPFVALPLPAGTGAAAGTPLVEENEIVFLPSASLLAALQRRKASPPPGVLAVVADPVFEPDDPRLTAAAAAPPRTIVRASDPSLSLSRLPYSREEATAILRLAPADRRFAALDFAANRDTVLGGVLSGYRILHFATHSVIDPQHPALSGIALSRVDREGRRRAGFLWAAEISHLRLPADLVVLSACRTALGKEVRGEGLMGLTQSFFQAGARRVVVSLWPVDDRATAALMTRFYREMLAGGRSPAAALRAAQRSLRREPSFQAPAFWAGFVLQGDL